MELYGYMAALACFLLALALLLSVYRLVKRATPRLDKAYLAALYISASGIGALALFFAMGSDTQHFIEVGRDILQAPSSHASQPASATVSSQISGRPNVADVEGSASPTTASTAAASTAPRLAAVFPTRVFAGPTQFPPTAFRAYGIVAFRSRPTATEIDRRKMICSAYVTTLLHYTEIKAPPSAQMVTVWPTETDSLAVALNARSRDLVCDDAVRFYGLPIALKAIQDAQVSRATLDGIGPFLLAWSPSAEKGRPDSLVLVSNLSDVTTLDQAKSLFSDWSDEIQENSELWEKGWNRKKVAIYIRLWADKYGPKFLALFGVKE